MTGKICYDDNDRLYLYRREQLPPPTLGGWANLPDLNLELQIHLMNLNKFEVFLKNYLIQTPALDIGTNQCLRKNTNRYALEIFFGF